MINHHQPTFLTCHYYHRPPRLLLLLPTPNLCYIVPHPRVGPLLLYSFICRQWKAFCIPLGVSVLQFRRLPLRRFRLLFKIPFSSDMSGAQGRSHPSHYLLALGIRYRPRVSQLDPSTSTLLGPNFLMRLVYPPRPH